MTESTTVQMSADDHSLSDADLATVTGGLEQGGAWRQGKSGHWVYDGWAKEGNKSDKYTLSYRKEYADGGKANYYDRNNNLVKTLDATF